MRPLFCVIALAVVLAASSVDARAPGAKALRNDDGIEQPEEDSVEETEAPTTGNPEPENPSTGNPEPENPSTGNPDPERPPQEGDACDPDLCRNTGFCQSFLRCDRVSRKLVREECGQDLVWNPKNANGTAHIHGGNCDVWENLDEETESQYRSDKNCLRCFWEALGECESDYLYQAPNLRHRTVLRLSCADGLIFDEEKETCRLCSDVQRSDGSNCCNAGNNTTPAPSP